MVDQNAEGHSNQLQIKKDTRSFNTKFFSFVNHQVYRNQVKSLIFHQKLLFYVNFEPLVRTTLKKREVTPIDMKRFKTLFSDSH